MSWLRWNEEKGHGQDGIDAYFRRQSEALEGKTIVAVREANIPLGGELIGRGTSIEFTDGTTYEVPIMPWNWWGPPYGAEGS